LAEFWTTYNPREPKEVILSYRSAPWDDIISGDEDDVQSEVTETDTAPADEEENTDQTLQDSPTINLIGRPPSPTHYVSVAVPAIQQPTDLPDPVAGGVLLQGVHLPPPRNPRPVFVSTSPSPLIDQVVQDLEEHQILVPCPEIVYAFRMFLIAKTSGAARPIVDLSPWTPLYQTPPI
jgi:hypothetical protein